MHQMVSYEQTGAFCEVNEAVWDVSGGDDSIWGLLCDVLTTSRSRGHLRENNPSREKATPRALTKSTPQ